MEPDITELEELNASKVSGVASPANGIPFLVLKAQETASSEHVHDSDTPSSESDAIEALLTKAVEEGFCGTDECEACKSQFGEIGESLKAKLKAKQRNALADGSFALPEKRGYPINDENHARAALSMLHNASPAEQKRIKAAVHAKYPDIGAEKEADESVEKSPGVPDESVKTPTEGGHIEGSGKSGLGPPATAGTRPSDSPQQLGGRSTYVIPAEAKAYGKKNPPPETETMKEWDLEIIDDAEKGNWMAMDNPLGMSSAPDSSIGGSAWEAYDSATLDSAAQKLATAHGLVMQIGKREATEAINGNASEWLDTNQLGCAADDITHALCLVAGLAYHEAAASKGAAEKAGPALAALRTARDHLTDLLGDGATSKPAGRPGTEEDLIMQVTKEELAKMVSDAALEAVAADRKARKQERKAKKNANNGGDIDSGAMHSAMGGTADADDVNSVMSGSPEGGITKSQEPSALEKQVAEMAELVKAMASQPRRGGPVLDGMARGSFPAAEGRLTDTATKGVFETDEIQSLQKQYDEALNSRGSDAAYRAQELGYQLSKAKLVAAHEAGIA